MIYIGICVAGAIYELSLGGTHLIEVTLVPLLYIILLVLWIYSVWCILDYYKTIAANFSEDNPDQDLMQNFHAAVRKESTRRLRPIWDSPLLVSRKNQQFLVTSV